MRIVFMGTPDFAVPCLQRILDDGHEVVGVFTQPDKPKGRGYTLCPPPVKVLALRYHLPVYQPAKLRDGTALEILKELNPQLIVVVAYGRILPTDILELPPMGCINIHGSLLPKYRGAAPIQWTVLNGDPVGGVTAMFLAEEMDTGDMILKCETPVDENETAGELFDRLMPLGAQCLSDTLKLFEEGKVVRTPQDHTRATVAPMLDKAMGEIDFTKSARETHNLIRGLNPWPSAWVRTGGKLLKLHRSVLRPDWDTEAANAQPGTVLDSKELIVACGDGALQLTQVQPEGKSRMAGADYMRGARLAVEDKLIKD